jgi:hypothetical protein
MRSLLSSFWPAASPWFRKNHGWLLALLWAGGQAACWRYYHGPHLMGDGIGYVACARQLVATGQLVGAHNYYYAGYVLFISLFLKLGLGMLAVALAQVGLSGLALVAFYRTVRRLSGGRWLAAALATSVLAGWVEVQSFNSFILTESLFTSGLIFCLWALVRARDTRSGALAAVLLLYTATIRPNGFVAPAGQFFWFIGHNFLFFSKLSLLKVGYFLGWPRPWYSLAHRAWVAVVFPLLYGLAARGLRRPIGLGPRYAAVAIVLQLGVIMLTVEEWGARFSGPFVPYWLALAALGAQRFRPQTALGLR